LTSAAIRQAKLVASKPVIPVQALRVYKESRREAERQISKWQATLVRVVALNSALQRFGIKAIPITEIEEEVQTMKTW